MAQVLGFEAILYYDADGVDVGTWTPLTNVKDVTLNMEEGEADVSTRAGEGYKATIGALIDASVEFEMVWDTDDEGFTALQAAFFARNAIGIAVMDGDIEVAGSQGLTADMAVLKFARGEALEDALKVNVTLKPTYSTTAPDWLTVAAS